MGAGRGLGAAIDEELVAQGAAVVVADRSEELTRATAERLRAGGRVASFVTGSDVAVDGAGSRTGAGRRRYVGCVAAIGGPTTSMPTSAPILRKAPGSTGPAGSVAKRSKNRSIPDGVNMTMIRAGSSPTF
jgi:NAD(P)-dependent dehydrogenase (short-subunit alcohol dehydrogenase family)